MKTSEEGTLKPRWGIVRSLILTIVRIYRRFIGPALGNNCRYYPSCSGYTLTVFTFLPIFHAFYLSTKRILSCNPYFRGGVDMPPGLPEKEVMDFLDKN
jgi:putative membrane protein insertion efficiency factor